MKGTIRLRLAAISEPEPMSRSVIRGRGDKVPPLFVGEGNVDYLCGGCGVVLANRVWRPSIGNVVAQCLPIVFSVILANANTRGIRKSSPYFGILQEFEFSLRTEMIHKI